MATLTTGELAALRNHAERIWRDKALGAITYTKAQVNAAFQGLEDNWETTARTGAQKVWKAEIGDSIEASAAGVFNATAKTVLAASYVTLKAQKVIDGL